MTCGPHHVGWQEGPPGAGTRLSERSGNLGIFAILGKPENKNTSAGLTMGPERKRLASSHSNS